MTPTDAVLHLGSAAGGGLGVGFVAKLLIKSWLKRHDQVEKTLTKAVELLTRLDERVKTLQEGQARMSEHDRQIAILQEQHKKSREDLNGLGTKMRERQL